MDNLAALFERLEAARIHHTQDNKSGAIDALGAVILYLRQEGATEAHTLPLVWLAHDYLDNTPGNVKPLFDAGREAIAAAAIDALTEGRSLTLKAASDLVAKATGGAKDSQQLRDWRKNLRGKDKARDDAREQYFRAKRAMATLRAGQFAGASIEAWRKGVLAMVQDAYGIKKG